ncbi:hypothetical protein O6H91_13G061100 [Diphasiastrum complanatum]|nr:hypothetical protein O6H91_13G061100 [Diphasiastrum complanatum]KAJ7533722.1 hypothetical protein O6H91_13G061100 [Diphasiastrum complanatum]
MDAGEACDAKDEAVKKHELAIHGHRADAAGNKSVKRKQGDHAFLEPKCEKESSDKPRGRFPIKQKKKRKTEETEMNRTTDLLSDGRPRCKRSDGRHWQCKDVAMEGRSMCEKHYYQIIERNKRRADVTLFSQKSPSNKKQKFQSSKIEMVAKKKKSKVLKLQTNLNLLPTSAKGVFAHEVDAKYEGKDSKVDLERNCASKALILSIAEKRKKKDSKIQTKSLQRKSGQVKRSKIGTAMICNNAFDGSSPREVVLSSSPISGIASLKQQLLGKKNLKNSLASSLLHKKKGSIGLGAFSKNGQSRNASQRPVLDNSEFPYSEKLRHLKYLLAWILPYLKELNKEQNKEVTVQGNLKGEHPLNVESASVEDDEQIACDNCGTSIVDFHRSCSNCGFNLCLLCCHELRKLLKPVPVEGDCESLQDESLSIRKIDVSTDDACARLEEKCSSEGLAEEAAINLQSSRMATGDRNLDYLGQPLRQKVCQNGSILCPRGCESFYLQLKTLFEPQLLAKLEIEATSILGDQKFVRRKFQPCSICEPIENSSINWENVRLAAYRKDSNDNHIYCPTSSVMRNHGLEHFQNHWLQSEPIIVKDVLAASTGLSWEPKFMWHALREMSKRRIKGKKTVVAIDFLDWSEVEINIRHFFAGFKRGCVNQDGRPVMLKLKNWPPRDSFDEHFSHYEAEFINLLPLHIYTHPKTGLLNLTSKLPEAPLNPDFRTRIDIGYGVHEERGVGDSVTPLHCDMFDVVNVLVHTAEVMGPALQCKRDELEKPAEEGRRYFSEKPQSSTRLKIVTDSVEPMFTSKVQSENLLPGASSVIDKARNIRIPLPSTTLSHVSSKSEIAAMETESLPSMARGGNVESPDTGSLLPSSQVVMTSGENLDVSVSREQNCVSASKDSVSAKEMLESEVKCGGALWDVFRREDLPKLEVYLIEHMKDFNQIDSEPIEKVLNPILDQKFYLSEKHKRRLKEEFQIEPWTFEQNLGEAVYVPAGCPYQVRNLKSCINVAHEFVSPEHVDACIELTNELRFLPWSHAAKEDKLQVKKMIIYGAVTAVNAIKNMKAGEANGMKIG